MNYKTCNVKCHFKFALLPKKGSFFSEQDNLKKQRQFLSKAHKYNVRWFVFPSAKIINLTGIKSFCHVQNIINEICEYLELRALDIRIDNSTIKFTLSEPYQESLRKFPVPLQKFHCYIKEKLEHENDDKPAFKVCLNLRYFPCIRIKQKGVSISVYSTGNAVILGMTCEEKIKDIVNLVSDIWRTFTAST